MAPPDNNVVTSWQPIAPEVGLWQVQSLLPNGLPVRTVSLKLADKTLLVIGPSPTLTPRNHAELRKMGKVSYILAPTKNRHQGLQAFGSKWAGARFVAQPAAIEHLTAKTGLAFESTNQGLRKVLPDFAQLLGTQGLRTGEIWLRVQTRRGPTWVVGDSIVNLTSLPGGIRGVWLRVTGHSPGLSFASNLKLKQLDDIGVFRSFVLQRLREDRPRVLVPSVGDVLHTSDLPQRIRALVDDKLGNS